MHYEGNSRKQLQFYFESFISCHGPREPFLGFSLNLLYHIIDIAVVEQHQLLNICRQSKFHRAFPGAMAPGLPGQRLRPTTYRRAPGQR